MKVIMLNIPTVGGDRIKERPIGRNPQRYKEMLDEIEELVVRADQLGIAGFGTAEHHFHTEGWEVMSAPLIFYAKLAAMTKNIKFIPLSLVPVAENPLRIAEQTAMFDQLFPGRIEVGVARGYQSRWLQTLAQEEEITSGVPSSDQRNREVFDEHLEVVRLAWREDCFNFNGKHFQVPFPYAGVKNWPPHEVSNKYGAPGEIADDGSVVKIGVVPPPLSGKELPIWFPFTISPATLTAAAQRGYNMVINPSDPSTVVDYCRRYQTESAKFGRELKLGEGIAALREVVIGESEDEAFDIACKGAGSFWFEYGQHFGFMENWRIPSDDPTMKPLKFSSVEELTKRMIDLRWIMAGTKNVARDQVVDLMELHGGGGSLEYLAWNFCSQGTLPRDQVLRQLELFGEHILPAIR